MSNSKLPSIMRTVTPSQAGTPSIASPASISERASSVVKTPSNNNGGMDIIRIVLIIAITGFFLLKKIAQVL